jgi:hypothetical protein
MAIDADGIAAQLISHAAATGMFETVNGHEPKNAPGNGLNVAIWLQTIEPFPGGSGLNAVTISLVYTIRLYLDFLSQPYDAIDPALMKAADALMTQYAGAFTLGGIVRDVDLFGESGTKLRCNAGYLDQDGKKFRAFVITLPIIVNDVWTEAP